jgi:predicted amidohydrolase YtcJ
MQKIGLTKDTPDPVPGSSYFTRDAQGNPTGGVVEAAAGSWVAKRLGLFTTEDIENGLPAVVEFFNSNGITTLYDAGFLLVPEAEALKALKNIEDRGELTARFFTSYCYWGKTVQKPADALAQAEANEAKYTTDLIHANVIKMFVDGTVEGQSAYMRQDYLPPAKGKGMATIKLDDMLAMGKIAAAAGFSVHNHAIGDAGIAQALEFQKELGKIQGTKTIAHVQVVPPDLIQRFIHQDSFFQTTPIWLMDDLNWTEKVLGEERYLEQVPLESMVKGGVKICFGSDFPVFPGKAAVNPFMNMWFAVNRGSDKTFTDPLFKTIFNVSSLKIAPPKSEAISVADCINAYTINGAEQLRTADKVGSITKGKDADFVVLSDDILNMDPEKLKDVRPVATFFQGKCVYEKLDMPVEKVVGK